MVAILGISAFYHDSAAALVRDGEIVAAAQEERFTRRKHDPGYPSQAIDYVLSAGGLALSDVDHVVFYDKPFLKFERLLETYIARAPRGLKSFRMAMPVWLREKLFLKSALVRELKKRDEDFDQDRLMFSEHHFSHAASAYYPSPFDQAVVLTLDGVGEWATTTVAVGSGNDLNIEKEIHFPHSLGLLYSAFTYYLGFKVNSGEYKVMGLAPYGEPKYASRVLEDMVDVKDDGSFRLEPSYFNYPVGLTMTNDRFAAFFGQPVRARESADLEQFHMDVAASVQVVVEEILLKMTRALGREYDQKNLCLAGGVALNCVANGKIVRDGSFKRVWVQPAAGDAGGALGAALAVWYKELGGARVNGGSDTMAGSYLGPSFAAGEVEAALDAEGARYRSLSDDDIIAATADALAAQKTIGWFQGRMEFGPRALGARSILADPRSETMQKDLNLKIKFRESFRPFAPAVLREDVSEWFELDGDSPYMLLVDDVLGSRRRAPSEDEEGLFGIDKLNVKRSDIPAVTHVDNSARIQTVHRETNPRFHALLAAFKERTGCPVLVNTSFNVRGEPIVGSPADAFRCFMGTDLDMLVVENCILEKADQDQSLLRNYRDEYDLD